MEHTGMKKLLVAVLVLALAGPFGCKGKTGPEEKSLAKKYAMYKASVYKDKEFKEWLATLEKAESVDLLAEEKYINQKKMQVDLSKVRLADEKEGYMESKHLADRPIVFIQDNVKAFVRPNMGSKVSATIPKGTIAFIKDEKAEWVMIYVGNMDGKWVTKDWVKDGYSADENLVVEAKDYESAMGLLKETSPDRKDAAMKNAREKLAELAKGSSAIADLARAKLNEIEGRPATETPVETPSMEPPTEKPAE
jgi:lipoprotein LenA